MTQATQATAGQVGFLRTLWREAAEAAQGDEKLAAEVEAVVKDIKTMKDATGSVPRSEVQALVDRFKAVKAQARKTKASTPHKPNHTKFPTVEPGRYALVGTDDVTRFYRVKAGTRKPSFRFVDVQASDSYWPVKGRAAYDVLAAISANPHGAQMLYAKELGRCYVCGRTLTDEKSRALGIGPVCRGEA